MVHLFITSSTQTRDIFQGRGDSLVPRDGSSYYEKVCLRGEISECRDRAWAFERVPDRMIQVRMII